MSRPRKTPEKPKRGRTRKPRPPGLVGELGEQIELLRKKAGIDSASLAESSGVSSGYLLKLERGDGDPTLLRIQAIAQQLGTTARVLLASCKSW